MTKIYLQVIHASLKCVEFFSITKQLWNKTILSVVQLVRLCQRSPAGTSFPGKKGTEGGESRRCETDHSS